MLTDSYEYYMRLALNQARKTLKSGDVPVGCLVVFDNEIIGRGYNQIEKQDDSLAHAEILAIKQAIKKYGHKHLLNCDIYISLEPCSMCAGAIVLARIKNVIYGASDSKSGACGSVTNIVQHNSLNHRCNVIPGVLETECSSVIKNFFIELRKQRKQNE